MRLLATLRFIVKHPLNEAGKLDALIRSAKWQIGSRLVRGSVVHEWVNGSRFLVEAGETGLTGNIYVGLHEFQDMAYVLHALRSSDLFVDVGANMGSYTILACAAIGARGYAFEPVPDTYARLVDNVRLNHMEGRVSCVNKGVGAQAGTMHFTRSRGPMNRALVAGEEGAEAVSVEMCSLDDILQGESPTILKIDVEGFETAVIEGAHQTLKKETLHSVIVELNGSGRRYGFDESHISALLSRYGFEPYVYEPRQRVLTRLHGKNLDSGNTLFVRDEALVRHRLKNAPPAALPGKRPVL
jgi:FkbM family methyltransferase